MDLLTLVLTFVVAGAGAYLGSYLKKKGENLATHEDIGELVNQMAAVTEATKTIEAKISNEMWSRQQRWEVQKSALLDSLKELASSEALLFAMVHAFSAKDHETDEGKERRREANENFSEAINAFWRTQLATEIVCGRKIADQLEKIDRLFAIVRNKARQGAFGEVWDTHFTDIQAAKRELGELIRKELEFDPRLAETSNLP